MVGQYGWPIYIVRVRNVYTYMRGSRKFFRGGPTSRTFFLVNEWIQILNLASIGPPTKRHLNGVSLAADDDPTLNAGLVAL